jgi:mannose-6-phosphate isomerase-like protein (cupin superfamily)
MYSGYHQQWIRPMPNNIWYQPYYWNQNYHDRTHQVRNNYYPYNRQQDFGPNPFVFDIEKATKNNNNFRTAIWTGSHFQITLMSIGVGEDIGLEIHPNLDQFLRIEDGQGIVKMGKNKNRLDYQKNVEDDFAIVIPAGTYHNLINTGNKPLKLYSIYAPPQHPFGTIHETKAIAMAAEENHHY